MADLVAIRFADEGQAATINYSIPMPGAHTGRRVVEVELDLDDQPFLPDSLTFGIDLGEAVGVSQVDSRFVLNQNQATRYFSNRLVAKGVRTVFAPSTSRITSRPIAPASTPEASTGLPGGGSPRTSITIGTTMPTVIRSVGAPVRDSEVEALFATYLDDLDKGIVNVPVSNWAGDFTTEQRPTHTDPVPRFFLVERYGISSFLGDYGMGRTVKTLTLLPGESMTISLRTWQSTRQSIEESSSIIDSHEHAARDRFSNQVQKETTDKATKSKTESWHAEAEAKGSWGFGSVKASGGGAGEYHSSREQFARQASDATTEHAAEASSKRELSISSSSERTEESGSESLIERTITNVNVRRALNFVFRELNQSYITKLHLKTIHVAFTNERHDSWREVPLSGLRTLLEETLEPSQVDRAARQILRMVGTVFDHEDAAVHVLERVTIQSNGEASTVEPARRDSNGDFAPPTDDMYYRFRPGPLNQEDSDLPVDGVVLSERAITMRTDSVVVEALLGQADALDPYAMEIQQAAATKESLAAEREQLILQTLAAIEDPERRAGLLVDLYGTCCAHKHEDEPSDDGS